MKIDKIVTAYDHNPLYSSFKDLTVEAWKRLGIEVQAEPMTPTRGVASAIMAKITRLLAASSEENTDKFVMIADIDMVPLASPLSAYDGCPDHHLCQFGYEHPAFQQAPDIGKWPMHGTAAKGCTFQKIVNPQGLSNAELLQTWLSGFREDPRSAIMNSPERFSDESLLRCLLSRAEGVEVSKIRRDVLEGYDQHPDGGYTVYGRICRSKWGGVTPEELDRYFEIHGPRPCDLEGFYKPVLEYIRKDK